MPIIKQDGLEESDGQVFKAIPASIYPIRTVKVEMRETGEKSKHPGRPMIELTHKVREGEEHEGSQLKSWFVLSCPGMDDEEKRRAVAKVKNLLTACEIEVDEDDNFDTDDLMGAECSAAVTVKKDDGGDEMNNIKSFLRSE